MTTATAETLHARRPRRRHARRVWLAFPLRVYPTLRDLRARLRRLGRRPKTRHISEGYWIVTTSS